MIYKNQYCEIEAYVNSGVIRALHLNDTPERSYMLGRAGLQFVIDERLQAAFDNRIDKAKLKIFIQKNFNGPLHLYDTSEVGYININGLPVVWHIKTHDKKTGEIVKAKHFQHESINFLVTIYKASDFAKIKN